MSETPTLDGTVKVFKLDGQTPEDALDPLAIKSNAINYEDEFKGLYGLGKMRDGIDVVEPPFNFVQLEDIIQQNNAVQPCVEAMVTNVAGTGYVIEPWDADTSVAMKDKIEAVGDFFKQPWPGESWVSISKKVRRDIENIGNGYIEVLRNAKGEIAFARYVEGKTMRLVSLGEHLPVEVFVRRGGKPVKFTVLVRPRRFAQVLNGKPCFFKEFGAQRDLDKNTGQWAKKGERLGVQVRATEIIHFTTVPDVKTPYGVPRWITQTPSVLGSRKAEEHNLDFFNSGGVPPIMLLVQGGTLAEKAVQAIQNQLNARNAKHRAAVVEAHSTSGSLDSNNNVRVTVERFGSERQSDSMFETYDKRCEERVRRAFRLPPLFVGQAGDYSFATAFASYTVAEAQVFLPERDEWDEAINLKLMPELDPSGELRYRSLPLAVKDVSNQLKGIEMAATQQAIDGEGLVSAVNEVTGLELKVREDIEDVEKAKLTPTPVVAAPAPVGAGGSDIPPGAAPDAAPVASPTTKSADALVAMADEVADVLVGGVEMGTPRYRTLIEALGGTNASDLAVVKGLVALKTFKDVAADPVGLADLAGCTLAALSAHRDPESLN